MDNILSGSISKDELVKSHIGWQFGNSENLKIAKKGSLIKERLIVIKEKEMNEANDYKSRAEALRVKLNCEPTEELGEWINDGVETIKPKVFNWSETYCESSNKVEDSISIDGNPVKSPEQEICDDKREHNRCVESYVRNMVEIKMIDTMINNLSDEKEYSLAVKQATILGF